MHMKSFVTFVHAFLDGASHLSGHFKNQNAHLESFPAKLRVLIRNNLLIKSNSFLKISDE